MANRWYDQFQQTLVRGLVTAFGYVQFNGSGAPTLVDFKFSPANSTASFATAASAGAKLGIKSIVRNGTGDYTITFVDKFLAVLAASCTFIGNTNAAAPIFQIKVASNPNTAASTCGLGWTGATGSPSYNAVEILFFSSQGTVADPANTELGVFSFQLMNNSAN